MQFQARFTSKRYCFLRIRRSPFAEIVQIRFCLCVWAVRDVIQKQYNVVKLPLRDVLWFILTVFSRVDGEARDCLCNRARIGGSVTSPFT